MKKFVSAFSILTMLALKHPPLPAFSLIERIRIVQVSRRSVRQIALEYDLN